MPRGATKVPFVQIDAFAETLLDGNPAAVMPLDHWAPDPATR